VYIPLLLAAVFPALAKTVTSRHQALVLGAMILVLFVAGPVLATTLLDADCLSGYRGLWGPSGRGRVVFSGLGEALALVEDGAEGGLGLGSLGSTTTEVAPFAGSGGFDGGLYRRGVCVRQMVALFGPVLAQGLIASGVLYTLVVYLDA